MTSDGGTKRLPQRLIIVAGCMIAALVSAFVAARVFPVFSLLSCLCVLSTYGAYLTIPAVRGFAHAIGSSALTHPYTRWCVTGAVCYCSFLLILSIAQLLPSRPAVPHKRRASTQLVELELALKFGEAERAEELLRTIESNSPPLPASDLAALKDQVAKVVQQNNTRRANDHVLRIILDAERDLQAKRYGAVRSALREAFSVKGATELQQASLLSSRLVQADLREIERRMAAGEVESAQNLMTEVESLPGVTDRSAIAALKTKLAEVAVVKRNEKAIPAAEADVAWQQQQLIGDADVASPLSLRFVRSRMDDEGNIVEIYATNGQLDVESLRSLCQQKRLSNRSKRAYWLVVFDDAKNATFPSTRFQDRYGTDTDVRQHIHAIYEFERGHETGELGLYDPALIGIGPRRERI